MVNGTFDIVHRGHIQLLNYARGLGDQLLVAIDTDRRVKELKGNSRPINNQDDRKLLLYNLKAVDIVMLFDNKEELVNIIQEFKPDIYVKGSDWAGKETEVQGYCNKVIYYDRVGEYSTTNTIQYISNR